MRLTRSLSRRPRLLPMLCVAAVLMPMTASAEPAALSWENICRTVVCRATGHDGVMDARISPDGAYVAVAVDTPDRQGIHLLSRDTGDLSPWVNGTSPRWFADGRRIVYVSDGDVWVIGLAGDKPVRLTNDEHDARAPRPSPDGRHIAFYSSRSGHQDLWLVASDGSGEPRQLTRESMAPAEIRLGHAWSPDGKTIAYYSNTADYWSDDLWIVDVESGEARQLSEDVMGSGTPAWSPDGSHIAVFGIAKDEIWYGDLSDLYVIEAASGDERRVGMQVHAMDIDQPRWSGDGSELFFPRHARGEVDLWRVPAAGGVATRLSNMGGLVNGFDATADAGEFIFVRSTPTRGREVDWLPQAGGVAAQLTSVATDWDGVKAPEVISYRSRDGHYIQAFVFTPPGFSPGTRYPALVQVHGGGTNSYYNGLNLVEQRLAQQGYVVMAINYRGGSGFGRAFQDMAVHDWANGQAQDAAAAADFIRAQPWSSGKVGIYGYSYGGIMSLAAVTRAPEAFDAAVPMAGIYDWADAYETADRLGRMFTRAGHGGSPEERPDAYGRSNSLARIEQVETPILLMHGEADARAPFRQFELVVEALARHDKVFESRSFPGQPHRFRDPASRVELYTRLEAWMDRWLK
ncbi:S9 family peptidase [Wenzhouxiangella sp. XN24]|uniref:S9 family peptidase n=1 Tax=Wenzhouxiangella sp. XN24 TaxID=2713569 RepID=UPI0013EB4F14|nr:S9 family peptidase [Wenzhouxiangella sp. XN24]NGX17677.1 S9 family peptidase [Wenzhouxiangella sp. XN24]